MENLFNLDGKVAVVTGASSGLGVQFAKALTGAGAKVALLARRVEKLDKVKEELLKAGKVAKAYPCDVSNEKEVISTVAQIEKDFGTIDILVNAAGVVIPGATDTYPTEAWNRVMSIDLTGLFLMSREVVKVMLKHDYGKIVNISSVAGLLANGYTVSYNASKAGVINLTRSFACEFAKRGITCNAIAPGVFASEMTEGFVKGEVTDAAAGRTPMARIGKEGELNGALLLLSSDASSYISGVTIPVDGGWTSLL
jgi:gluconate 5-dehydrogenase